MVIKDMNEKKARIICLILTAVILIFAYIEEIYIQPGYLIKCIIKVSTFGGVMILYSALAKKKFLDIINLKKPEKIGILIGGIVGAVAVCGIAGAFFMKGCNNMSIF